MESQIENNSHIGFEEWLDSGGDSIAFEEHGSVRKNRAIDNEVDNNIQTEDEE